MKANDRCSRHIVPKDKHDLAACQMLSTATDDEVVAQIDSLLTCLKDLNWPIAGPVSNRLALLDHRLISPVHKILLGDDETWKYWIISYLLHHVNPAVLEGLRFVLDKMVNSPTNTEVENDVNIAAYDLIVARPIHIRTEKAM